MNFEAAHLLLFYKFPSTTIIVVYFKASFNQSAKSLKNFLSESDICSKLFSISFIIFNQSFFLSNCQSRHQVLA